MFLYVLKDFKALRLSEKEKRFEMAAYAALLSLMHTIHHIKIHPRPPISLDQKQVESLMDNVTLLQKFLECYSSEENDELESRIAAAAYAAEDVIESHIVDQIHARSKISNVDLCQCLRGVMDLIKNEVMKIMGSQVEDPINAGLYGGLERVIVDMDLIKKEVMEAMIKEKIMRSQHHHLHSNSSVSAASVRPASKGRNSTMARFDDVLINEILDKLSGQQRHLQIIPIVGMGGIGKTTLARNVYSNQLIVQHFDILAWVTISQVYSRKTVLQVLCKENKGSEMSEEELGEMLHKHLWGRRYLIVMDDIWSIQAWDQVKFFFPDNNNGSRIMITTMLSNLGYELSDCHIIQMKFLNEDKSWDLLCEIVFGKELDCPIELENVGKEIARSCRGLPLSIVVIGGVLTHSNGARAHWEYTLQNLNSLINLEDSEYCLQILRTSYMELSMHLKPCFLYMGIFSEDDEILVSDLIELWIAEGIVRPIDDKRLEEVAEEYVKELIDKNLILIHELSWNGEAEICKMHDLLRDLCLREAQKQRFLCVLRQTELDIPLGVNMERHICIHDNTTEECCSQFNLATKSMPLTRSFVYKRRTYVGETAASPTLCLGLLRVYSVVGKYNSLVTYSDNTIFQQANLRYLCLYFRFDALSRFNALCFLLWNIQTLKVVIPFSFEPIIAPAEIWGMPSLRHAILNGFQLPDPPCGMDNFVLENLQNLSGIINFKCSEEVVRRIPNIKTLKFKCRRFDDEELPDLCLNNLGRLQKLESVHLYVEISHEELVGSHLVQNITFPLSLKKLTLYGTMLKWEDLTTKVGSLPFLEFLKLDLFSCKGPVWETLEGQFCSLMFLQIDDMSYMRYWITDGTHFPRLEHIVLRNLEELEEIPSSIGDIPTLKSIQLICCSQSAADSVEIIKEEQEDNGNEELQVLISKI
ncbi:hypothetical protein ACS0TY_017218 [Phlomoides rotata]